MSTVQHTGRPRQHAADPYAPAVLSGAEMLWRVMASEGVEVVFGYPGGAILPAYDALGQTDIHHVLTRHEQGAAHMADGFARKSGRVGVAIATSGPGATNLVTGLATAMADSIPIVCITGQVPSHALGTDAFQETDVIGLTAPVTKHGRLVTRPEDVPGAIREAFGIARSGRPGPVIVDITKDAQLGRAAFEDPGPLRPRPDSAETPRRCTSADLDDAAVLVQRARRPLIFCGHGVIQSGSTDLLRRLAEAADVPVVCTLLGLGGFPADHPLHLGMLGMHGAPWVNQAVQMCDLIIAVGMRFDDRVTGTVSTFAPHAHVIHIERDPAEVGKVVEPTVALVGDAADVVAALHSRITPAARPAWRDRIERLREAALPLDVAHNDDGSMLGALVVHDLWRYTGGGATVVSDVGQHQMWAAQYHAHQTPRTLLTSGGMGTMGFALPAAIGARFADPDAEIWVIVGDGGFQMTACELSTLAQEGLKVIVAIINNSYLGMVRQWQHFSYGQRYVATPLHNPDFCLLAEAHGLTALRVTDRADIAAAVAAARAAAGAVVIDFRVIEEDIVYPMIPPGASLDDMIRRPGATGAEATATAGSEGP